MKNIILFHLWLAVIASGGAIIHINQLLGYSIAIVGGLFLRSMCDKALKKTDSPTVTERRVWPVSSILAFKRNHLKKAN